MQGTNPPKAPRTSPARLPGVTTLPRWAHAAPALLVALALLLAGCAEPPQPASEYTLYRHLVEAGGIDIEAPADAALRATLTRAAELEARALSLPVRIVAPGEAARGVAHMIVGLPDSPGAPELLARLGVRVESGGFRIRGAPAELLADALVATLEDPSRPGHAVTLVCAPDAAGLEPLVRSVRLAWRGGLRAYRAGELLLEARLAPDGALQELEYLGDLRAELAAVEPIDDDGLVIHVAPGTPERELLSWRRANVAVRREVAGVFGGSASEPLEAQTYAHIEDLRRLTRGSELSSLNPATGAVHALVAHSLPHDGGFAVGRALALRLGGRPAQDWMLDGVAAAAVTTWWGQPKPTWVGFLLGGEQLPPPEVLVDPLAAQSKHVLVPLRGVLFAFLVKRLGVETMREVWRGDRELVLDAPLLEAFEDTLATMRERRAEMLHELREQRLSSSLQGAERRKGVNLLAPPDAGYLRGFGTRACERSLDDLAATGANSVALAFRGAMEIPPPRFALAARHAGPKFMVSDLELIATARGAQARGLSIMFKPELLTRPSGIRIGDKAAESPAEAERFFASSRRCLPHVGLVAELCGAEVLCLGTELRHVAGTLNPQIPDFMQQNQEAWSELIATLRGSFMGALTYAADWRGEVDSVEFWSQLDFVGVVLYPSLGNGPEQARPSEKEAGRRMLLALGNLVGDADRRYQPALICEVGFSATSRAWDQPEAARGRPDVEEQARMYGILRDVFADNYLPREMFEGLYLWSWSTDPDAGREPSRSFTPQNRPAREVAAQLFEAL